MLSMPFTDAVTRSVTYPNVYDSRDRAGTRGSSGELLRYARRLVRTGVLQGLLTRPDVTPRAKGLVNQR
jgi:hypothetical protein